MRDCHDTVSDPNQKPPRVTYTAVAANCFERRGLRRYAGIWSLCALGVGAVISSHFSGWNLGLASGGWGGMMIAAAIMAVMFLCLSFSIAEMSAALPLSGGSYSYARMTLGLPAARHVLVLSPEERAALADA